MQFFNICQKVVGFHWWNVHLCDLLVAIAYAMCMAVMSTDYGCLTGYDGNMAPEAKEKFGGLLWLSV